MRFFEPPCECIGITDPEGHLKLSLSGSFFWYAWPGPEGSAPGPPDGPRAGLICSRFGLDRASSRPVRCEAARPGERPTSISRRLRRGPDFVWGCRSLPHQRLCRLIVDDFRAQGPPLPEPHLTWPSPDGGIREAVKHVLARIRDQARGSLSQLYSRTVFVFFLESLSPGGPWGGCGLPASKSN